MSSGGPLVARVPLVVFLSLLSLLALLTGGCGGGAARVVPPAKPTPSQASSNVAGPAAPSSGPTLDALAARGPTDAPLMREVLRVEHVESPGTRPAVIRAERDLCVRAIFGAAQEVRAWFEDEAHAPYGESTIAKSGLAPPRGPACFKKGETLRFVVESRDPASKDAWTRVVVFAAP